VHIKNQDRCLIVATFYSTHPKLYTWVKFILSSYIDIIIYIILLCVCSLLSVSEWMVSRLYKTCALSVPKWWNPGAQKIINIRGWSRMTKNASYCTCLFFGYCYTFCTFQWIFKGIFNQNVFSLHFLYKTTTYKKMTTSKLLSAIASLSHPHLPLVDFVNT